MRRAKPAAGRTGHTEATWTVYSAPTAGRTRHKEASWTVCSREEEVRCQLEVELTDDQF